MGNKSIQKVRAIYSGRVQGVGFRMTVSQLARRLPVTGMVCNVSDGSVEMVAVGDAKSLTKLLQEIDRAMSRNIVHCQLDWLDGQPQEFTEFSIATDKWKP
ncbi:MAG: acylphosphatase [Pirellulaceae bacterium]|nr:acylphosphatase [Pirellulaceae bacterium]